MLGKGQLGVWSPDPGQADLSSSAGGFCGAETAPSDTAFVQASDWFRTLYSSDSGRSFTF